MRGYGFVAAEDGRDDIFLHASVFDRIRMSSFRHEARIQGYGGRPGADGIAVRLTDDEPAPDLVPAPQPVPSPPTAPVLPPTQAGTGPAPGHDQGPDDEQLAQVHAVPGSRDGHRNRFSAT